jgi:hypothetical protein
MEVGQGPNCGCSAKGKKIVHVFIIRWHSCLGLSEMALILEPVASITVFSSLQHCYSVSTVHLSMSEANILSPAVLNRTFFSGGFSCSHTIVSWPSHAHLVYTHLAFASCCTCKPYWPNYSDAVACSDLGRHTCCLRILPQTPHATSRILPSKKPHLLLSNPYPLPHIRWVPGTISPGVKRPGHEADHSPPASAEVKKTWVYTSTRPYVFMM